MSKIWRILKGNNCGNSEYEKQVIEGIESKRNKRASSPSKAYKKA